MEEWEGVGWAEGNQEEGTGGGEWEEGEKGKGRRGGEQESRTWLAPKPPAQGLQYGWRLPPPAPPGASPPLRPAGTHWSSRPPAAAGC